MRVYEPAYEAQWSRLLYGCAFAAALISDFGKICAPETLSGSMKSLKLHREDLRANNGAPALFLFGRGRRRNARGT